MLIYWLIADGDTTFMNFHRTTAFLHRTTTFRTTRRAIDYYMCIYWGYLCTCNIMYWGRYDTVVAAIDSERNHHNQSINVYLPNTNISDNINVDNIKYGAPWEQCQKKEIIK